MSEIVEPFGFTPLSVGAAFALGRRMGFPAHVAVLLGRPNVSLLQQDGQCEIKVRCDRDTLAAVAQAWRRDARGAFETELDRTPPTGEDPRFSSTLFRQEDDFYWSLTGVAFLLGGRNPIQQFGPYPTALEWLTPVRAMDRFAERALALTEAKLSAADPKTAAKPDGPKEQP